MVKRKSGDVNKEFKEWMEKRIDRFLKEAEEEREENIKV